MDDEMEVAHETEAGGSNEYSNWDYTYGIPPFVAYSQTSRPPQPPQLSPPSSDMDLDDRISVRSNDQSVYSYNSSRDSSNFLRAVQGRIFNSQNPLYFLPADETEWNRLDKQHLLLLLAVGSLFVLPDRVRARLAEDPGEKKTILDLGTGGGNWAISMAQEFPYCDVVGVDLAPSTTRPPPDNCRFEFDDINRGLPHYYGKFDIVHARSTANGLPNFEGFLGECARCLKPGGILLLTEGEFALYNHEKQMIPVPMEGAGKEACWMQRLLFEAYNVMKLKGSSMDAGRMFPTYLQRNNVFSETGYEAVYTPVGPWERGTSIDHNQRLKAIGTLMRQNALEFTKSLKPTFASAGYPEDLVKLWIARTEEQLLGLHHPINTKWHYAWAVLKEHPEHRRITPLPPPTSVFNLAWPLHDCPIDPTRIEGRDSELPFT